jgi:hypothetical protein
MPQIHKENYQKKINGLEAFKKKLKSSFKVKLPIDLFQTVLSIDNLCAILRTIASDTWRPVVIG